MEGNNIQRDGVNTWEPLQELKEVKKTLEEGREQLENWRKMQIEAFKRFKSKIDNPAFS